MFAGSILTMTREQLKQLEADLWSAADNLRQLRS
jgi:hypothetical protein